MRRRQGRFLALVALVGLAAALAVLLAGRPFAPGHAPRAAVHRLRVPPSTAAATTTSAPATTVPATTTTTTTTTTVPTTTVPTTQTDTLPSASTPGFRAEMAALFRGIQQDAPAIAAQAFFPEAAYTRLKAIPAPAADYEDRLVADYRMDVAAAHALLGAGAMAAHLVAVEVPAGEAAWIPPGYCYNSIGYWHDPGARLLYDEGGQLRSIGIASLISWHGVWYVVHLGAVLRSAATGLVDSPAVGPGTPGPPGGC